MVLKTHQILNYKLFNFNGGKRITEGMITIGLMNIIQDSFFVARLIKEQ